MCHNDSFQRYSPAHLQWLVSGDCQMWSASLIAKLNHRLLCVGNLDFTNIYCQSHAQRRCLGLALGYELCPTDPLHMASWVSHIACALHSIWKKSAANVANGGLYPSEHKVAPGAWVSSHQTYYHQGTGALKRNCCCVFELSPPPSQRVLVFHLSQSPKLFSQTSIKMWNDHPESWCYCSYKLLCLIKGLNWIFEIITIHNFFECFFFPMQVNEEGLLSLMLPLSLPKGRH